MKPVDSQSSHSLSPGTELSHNYIINNILGEGGFGITYSGTIRLTGEKVAIKEYFPNGLAHRECIADNACQIVPFIGSEEAFLKGCQHFLNEASILKEFQNLNSIVSVKDVIETNGTAYLVMEYIDGITLKQYVKENGALTFQELLPLVKPVIHALIQVHKQGLIHRDISPENLMIGIDNQLHLIDFGAASIENGHEDKTMTVILKSGYAPPEQYLSNGKQGAWTDIYALCATMYMTLTGFAPPESIRRIQHDDLPSLAELADITSWQAAAIEKGMNLTAADRFQNMESLYQALIIPPMEMNSKRRSYQNSSIEENKTIMKRMPITTKHRKPLYSLILMILLFVALLTGVFLLNRNPISSSDKDETAASDTSTEYIPDSLCTMISLTGDSLATAKEKLSQLDESINVHTQWVYDDTYAANTIIEQSIQAGTDFTKGSLNSILLTISKGAKPSAEVTTESTRNNTVKNTTNDTLQNNSTSEAAAATDKTSGSSNIESATSDKSTTEKSNFDITPIEKDDEYDTFIIN